jgi:hypothetical protein
MRFFSILLCWLLLAFQALAAQTDRASQIANLEMMPLRMNEQKKAKIGDRQRDLAKKFYQAGLLSRKGLEAVLK